MTEIFGNMFQKYLVEAKPPGEPTSYRPNCLLNTMEKILKTIVYNRLLVCVETKGALSSNCNHSELPIKRFKRSRCSRHLVFLTDEELFSVPHVYS